MRSEIKRFKIDRKELSKLERVKLPNHTSKKSKWVIGRGLYCRTCTEMFLHT